MKRMTYFVMALAMVLGLAQCKKEQPVTPQSEGVMITLNVGDNHNGSRANVNPTAAEGVDQVTFENGDEILVASDGKYVGTLTRTVGVFSGSITNPVEGQKLYFYFLGNKADVDDLTAGSSTTCTVNISDQTGYPTLPVISMGKSTVNYSSDVTSYSSRLYNKCSLMKFNVTTPSDAAICITGMNNEVIVDFGDPNGTTNGFTYDQVDGGLIKLKGGSGTNVEKWAIVLPQAALTTTGDAYSEDNAYIGIRPTLDAITSNQYLGTGVAMTVNTPDYAFTVDGNGTTVYFSKGNLQYKYGEGWRFAEHQWDFTGEWNTSSWVDLFGWGTWGEDKNPLETDEEGAYHWSTDFQGELDGHSDWRTLTHSEWDFVINNSNRGSNRYLKANIAVGSINYNGLILFPDNYDGADLTGYTYNNTSGWTSVSAEDWSAMEAVGAVFLPAAGNRYGTEVLDAGDWGSIWSSTPDEDIDAYGVDFNDGFVSPDNYDRREYGQSVRLVRNAK